MIEIELINVVSKIYYHLVKPSTLFTSLVFTII